MIERPYFLQRLLRWTPDPFCGGIPEVCVFDYMGNAVFENGAVPKALKIMHENIDEYSSTVRYLQIDGINIDIYILCKKGEESMIVKFLPDKYMSDREHYDRTAPTCERVLFKEAVNKIIPDLIGWLEIDPNSFYDSLPCFFTLDKEMFDKFVAFIKVE